MQATQYYIALRTSPPRGLATNFSFASYSGVNRAFHGRKYLRAAHVWHLVSAAFFKVSNTVLTRS